MQTHGDGRQKMTMEQRIQAFYQQSGGPNNPKIREFLDNHLLYGKDHGPPGYKENLEDAFIDMVVGDPSMLMLFQRYQRWRNANRATSEMSQSARDETYHALEREVVALRDEVTRLRVMLERMTGEDDTTQIRLPMQPVPPRDSISG